MTESQLKSTILREIKREEVDIVYLRIKVMKFAYRGSHEKSIAVFLSDVTEEQRKKCENQTFIASYCQATLKTIRLPLAQTLVRLQKDLGELRLIGQPSQMLQPFISDLEIVLSRTKDLDDLRFVYDDSLKAKRVGFSPYQLLQDIVRIFEATNTLTQVRLSLTVVDESFNDKGEQLNHQIMSM